MSSTLGAFAIPALPLCRAGGVVHVALVVDAPEVTRPQARGPERRLGLGRPVPVAAGHGLGPDHQLADLAGRQVLAVLADDADLGLWRLPSARLGQVILA